MYTVFTIIYTLTVSGAAIGGIVGLSGGAAGAYLLAGKATASVGAVVIGSKLFIAGFGATIEFVN